MKKESTSDVLLEVSKEVMRKAMDKVRKQTAEAITKDWNECVENYRLGGASLIIDFGIKLQKFLNQSPQPRGHKNVLGLEKDETADIKLKDNQDYAPSISKIMQDRKGCGKEFKERIWGTGDFICGLFYFGVPRLCQSCRGAE